jgi:hypothetical protein
LFVEFWGITNGFILVALGAIAQQDLQGVTDTRRINGN